MKRKSGRAASPELSWIIDSSTPSSSSLSPSPECSFRELDDEFLQTQTRIWVGEVLHLRFDEEMTIADLLADGEVLFQLSKVVWEMMLTKCVETKYLKAHIYEPTAFGNRGGRYLPYSNVDAFLKICQMLGLTGIDLFTPSDVVEKRDIRRVCMCIRSLSKKARSKHLEVPDFDIVTYTIAMPTDLVGCIRRSLERSQCSSSNSAGCTSCMDSKEKYKKNSWGAVNNRSGQLDLSSEEFDDDAESNFKVVDFQSPASPSVCYEDGCMSDSIRGCSPGANLQVEENSETTPIQNSEKDKENHETNTRTVDQSNERRSVHCKVNRKRQLVSSVAGGMAIFGALFFLLHIRKRAGKDTSSDASLQIRKPTQKKNTSQKGLPPTNKVNVLYPGERLKL